MRSTTRLAWSAFAAVLFVGTIQAPASADPAPVGSDSGYVIVEQDGAGVVSVPDTSLETAKEKEAWLAERDQGLQTSATTLKSNGSKSVSGGYLNVVGSSSLTSGCGVFSCWRKFGSNWGDFSWIGSGNISTIQGSLKWWLSGVNVSFSLPAGAASRLREVASSGSLRPSTTPGTSTSTTRPRFN